MTEKIEIDKEDFEFLLDLASDGLFGTYKSDARFRYGKEWNKLLEKYSIEGYAPWSPPNYQMRGKKDDKKTH